MVAGTNYFAKVRYADGKFAHVRIYEASLAHSLGLAPLTSSPRIAVPAVAAYWSPTGGSRYFGGPSRGEPARFAPIKTVCHPVRHSGFRPPVCDPAWFVHRRTRRSSTLKLPRGRKRGLRQGGRQVHISSEEHVLWRITASLCCKYR